ncbi:MAG: flagellar biosynthesis protein FliQ [Pseudomonadota bacterium]
MDESEMIDVIRQAAWSGLAVSAPILVVALLTGLAIGLLQALTSVQELTLTFVPKLVAIVVVFVATQAFMTGIMIAFFGDMLDRIAGF